MRKRTHPSTEITRLGPGVRRDERSRGLAEKGYDILSFEPDGRRRLIEVKTTTGVATTPFFLTRNEEAFAREKADEFRLARVYDFTRGPRMFELTPPLEGAVRLETETWRASFR